MSGRVKYAQMVQEVAIPVKGNVELNALLTIVDDSSSIVVMANGNSSGRFSSRNCYVAEEFNKIGFSTLHIDLLTTDEECVDLETGEYRFDIELLADRVKTATKWLIEGERTSEMRVAYLGTNASAAAVLSAAAEMQKTVEAVVSLGGRCDLVGFELPMVKAQTLFVVGEHDTFITAVTRNAMDKMKAGNSLVVIEGANHHFEEPGAIEEVADAIRQWLSEVFN